ncbi:MAG: DUF1343 domain-containing protein [Myxococcales bacterium]|jgi:uncharacterized protein YbbC (DUF1343 family)|nr:DUF1343 domain-containing protein [Myxococcales bacterium]
MLVGLDQLPRLSALRKRLADSKLAVLTHTPAVDGQGRQTLEVLRSLELQPSVVFSPEHGLDGLAQAEEPVGQDDADAGGAPLVSLYGTSKESLRPRDEDWGDAGMLLIDLVDVGSRYYTYVWTALLCARAAAERGVHTVVLDRPNPIGGDPALLEGRPQDPELCSFVGLEPTPIRHGMTVGELVAYFLNQEDRPLGPDGVLSVVPTRGWERYRTASAHGRPFVPPSPNMPTEQTALVYPGGCLLEGTNLSEGRGTTTPFQSVGAPYLSAGALAQALGEVPGAWVRPHRFRPSFGKHQGEVCNGVMLHVTDPARFRPVETYLRLIAAARALAPEAFALLDRPYEFETEHCAFDLLTGTPEARAALLAGASGEELAALVCPVDEEWKLRVETAEELLQEIRA